MPQTKKTIKPRHPCFYVYLFTHRGKIHYMLIEVNLNKLLSFPTNIIILH